MLARFIPEWLQSRLAGRHTVKRVAGNTAWLAFDQVVRLGVGFLVTASVARYLGVDRFGQLNYATAFCAPFAALVSLSLNGIAVRDLAKEPGNEGEILGTAFGLKCVGAAVALAVGMTTVWNAAGIAPDVRLLVTIVMIGTVLQAGDVLDIWFQGRGEARVGAMSRSAAFLVLAAVKLGLVFAGAPLVWFALAVTAEVALCTIIWIAVHSQKHDSIRWRFSRPRAFRLMLAAWPLAVAGVAVQIQAYVDQVLLGGMKGTEELGHYSAALRLVAVFGFIPVAIQAAAAPEIARAHGVDSVLYARRIRDVYRITLAATVLAIIPLLAIPGFAIGAVFGKAFSASAALVPLLTPRLMLTSLGVVRGVFITNEGLFGHAAVTAIIGMILNLLLNVLLIPILGALGCVIAALVSFTMNTVVLDVFNARARYNLRILVSAIGLGVVPR